ncbi:MAG: thioredoxin family protein [Gemmatimonadota bacterium]
MNQGWKLIVTGMVLLAVGVALALKPGEPEAGAAEIPYDPSEPVPVEPVPESYESSESNVPRLVALGAGECIPCRAMAPIRAELRREYAGALEVDFYDVWKDREAGYHFGIQVIPTLIYYDARGRELERQQGYVSKERILETMERLGVRLPPPSSG